MKIEAGNIYYRKNANSAMSCIVVLGTTKVGMTYTFINSIAKVYGHIDACKLSIESDEHERYAEFDRLHYMPWNKLYINNYSLARKCSFKEMNDISSAIKDFILCNITQDNSGVFHYKDEIPAVDEHSKDDALNNRYGENHIKNTSKAENGITDTNTSAMETCDEGDDTTDHTAIKVVCRKSDTTNFAVNSDIIEEAKEHSIPIQETNDANLTETKMYDLMNCEVTAKQNDYFSKYPAKRSAKKNNYSGHRMFTEEEAFIICFMNINSISKKYNVSKSRACTMLKNAKTIFGYPVTDREIRFDYHKMIEMGYSIEKISEITGNTVGVVKRYVEFIMINEKNASNADNCRAKWDEIIKSGDIGVLTDAISTKIIDFAKKEVCSISVARDILSKIKDKLYIDPMYAIGFDKLTKDVDSYVESIRGSKKESDQANIIVYNIAIELKEAYQKSYNNHAEILAGSEPIPDTVKDSYRDYFMAMIYNRLNDTRILAKNRPLTKSQKLVIENGSVSECKIAFMNVNIKSYKAVKEAYYRP